MWADEDDEDMCDNLKENQNRQALLTPELGRQKVKLFVVVAFSNVLQRAAVTHALLSLIGSRVICSVVLSCVRPSHHVWSQWVLRDCRIQTCTYGTLPCRQTRAGQAFNANVVGY